MRGGGGDRFGKEGLGIGPDLHGGVGGAAESSKTLPTKVVEANPSVLVVNEEDGGRSRLLGAARWPRAWLSAPFHRM